MTQRRSRLAPSPTGALHLGNSFAFLANWAIAKQQRWELLFRLEDLDGPRKKIDTMQQSIDILQWLGLDWQGEVLIQSEDLKSCKDARDVLVANNRAYHCTLTRAQIESATSAPHESQEFPFSAIRPTDISSHNSSRSSNPTNWRFAANGFKKVIQDELAGNNTFLTSTDFVIWTKSDLPSYQLAVVVDDHRQGITDVVRGKDLLESAAWQEELYDALGWEIPKWWHLPLIVGTDGKRLAKRHGDSRLITYRAQGVTPERIIGLISKWCGIQKDLQPMNLQTFCRELEPKNLCMNTIEFTREEEQWLLNY